MNHRTVLGIFLGVVGVLMVAGPIAAAEAESVVIKIPGMT